MWLRYVFRAIILIGIAYGSYVLWSSQKKKTETSQESLELAEMIAVQWDASTDAPGELYKILAHYHRKKAEGKDIWKMFDDGLAASENAFLKRASGPLARSIKENFNRAEKCGVFDRESNVSAMESGRAPLVLKGPYYNVAFDTYVATTRIVSPIFAPEAANALPNLVIVPEPIAELRIEEVDDAVLRTAVELKTIGALSTETYDLLNSLRRKQKEEEK